jgi:hypothetical protein
MLCKTCGEELPATATVCPKCRSFTDVTAKSLASKVMKWVTVTILLLVIAALVPAILENFGAMFGHSKDKAYLTAMKSDLGNLWTAEESHWADKKTYTATIDTTVFRPAAGVTVTIGTADGAGFNATATHQSLPGRTCAIFGGSGPAVAPATITGEVACIP